MRRWAGGGESSGIRRWLLRSTRIGPPGWDNANFNTPTSSPFFKYAFCREDDTIKLAMNFYFGSSRIRSRRCLRSSCALALPNVCYGTKQTYLMR